MGKTWAQKPPVAHITVLMNELLNFNIAIKIEHILQAALNAFLVRQDLPSRQPGRRGSYVAQAQRAPTLCQHHGWWGRAQVEGDRAFPTAYPHVPNSYGYVRFLYLFEW